MLRPISARTGRRSPDAHPPFTRSRPQARYRRAVDSARIAAIPLFANLPDESLAFVAEIAGELEIAPGENLAVAGDFGYALFAVEEGGADVIRDDEKIGSVGPGDVIGEIATLHSGRRTASVVATSPMRVVTFLARDVWRIERELPEVGVALRASIDARLQPHDTKAP
jgi:CRP/FNR family transcriptional regulator, cyclic AMP receptor protein